MAALIQDGRPKYDLLVKSTNRLFYQIFIFAK
jgi:hypothetical protein